MSVITEVAKTEEIEVAEDDYNIPFGEDGCDEYEEPYEYEDVFYGFDYE